MTQKQSETLTPCWYVKDFADGWIKFYDVDMAIVEAKASGAIMLYSENGTHPEPTRSQPSETPVADGVRHALVCATMTLSNTKFVETHRMLEEALAILDRQACEYAIEKVGRDNKELRHNILADLAAAVRGMRENSKPWANIEGCDCKSCLGFDMACDRILALIGKAGE